MPSPEFTGSFEAYMVQSQTRVETKLDGVNERLDKLNGQVDRHAAKLEEHGNALVTLNEIQTKLTKHESQLDEHQTALDQSAGGSSASSRLWSAIWGGGGVALVELFKYLYAAGHR